MNIHQLNFDHLPPLQVPLRFFLTAPIFGMLAGALLLAAGPETWQSRWHPALLGLTHLLTLGVLGMVMVGALFQVLPVIGAAPIRHAARLARPLQGLLALGTLCLSLGLYGQNATLMGAALALLAAAFVLFLPSFFRALRQLGQCQISLHNIGLAGIALLITVVLGIRQLGAWLAPQQWLLDRALTDLHAGWGLLGWCLLLVIGVSYQVIPMFHVTPAFPHRLQRMLGPLMTLLLVLLTLLVFSAAPGRLRFGLMLLLAAGGLLYGAVVWVRLQQRKRKVADASVRCWQLAALCLPLAAGLWLSGQIIPAALLFLYGFVLTVIEGMLLKIIPFLIHLHLQRQCGLNMAAFAALPHLHEIVPTRRAHGQLYLHGVTLALLVLCAWAPALTPLAGVAMIAEFAWLLGVMARGLRLYRQRQARIVAQLEAAEAAG